MFGFSVYRSPRPLVGVLLTILLGAAILAQSSVPALAADKKPAPVDLSVAVIGVAKRAIPSVAHIEVTAQQDVAGPALPFDSDPFFRYFFGTPQEPRKFKREMKGLGTGIIIDGQGHILTNHHVVGGASKIEITLSNGSKQSAKLVGSDPKTDLAVVKIATKERLPYLTFGDSDKVEVGEWVVAIGHPRGLDQTVTQGIISAKHRRGITDPSSYQDFLQTDAAINPGNSGGPLLNLQGEVIGVNTIIVSESGGFEGIGLAIPSNMALHVAKLIITHGKVQRGWIGVSAQDLTPEIAKPLGISVTKGALVNDVVKESPADKAGVKRGDVIVAYQGREVPDASTLRNEAAISPIGGDARITLLREGKRQEITIKIGDLKDATKSLASSVKERLGAEVRALTPKEADQYGLSLGQGIVVSWISPKGPFGQVGFEVGDLILEVNGQAISSLENFLELISSVKANQRITLLAVDHATGKSGYVQVKVR
jgi:serine protease Do